MFFTLNPSAPDAFSGACPERLQAASEKTNKILCKARLLLYHFSSRHRRWGKRLGCATQK